MSTAARRRWPLRRRLVAVMLTVVTAVLVATIAGFMTIGFSAPYTDVDDRLRAAQHAETYTDVAIQIVDRDGVTLRVLQRQNRGGPQTPSASAAAHAIRADAPVTVGDAGTTWRLRASPLPDGTWLVAGLTITDLQGLYDNLVLLWTGAVALILLITGLLTTHLVRYGMRPLTEIAGAARHIQTGDLSRRLPATSRDEVGQVATAINSMLDRIEAGFAQRQAIEHRLRLFVHDAGHELRTPVTAIRGWADLYQTGAIPPDELPTAMRRIADEAQRVGLLVDQLLQLASLDDLATTITGGTVHRTVDLAEVVRDAVLDAQAVEPDRPITTELPDPGVAVVQGDPTALHQVVANLLGNVRAHTPAGTPARVNVRRVAATDGERVVLRVADDGPGVPDDMRGKVFDRFFRADPGRTHHGHVGYGLGLSIVAAIIAGHGGDVHAEPAETGFTVRISLPAE